MALVLAVGATWLVWRSFAVAPRTTPATSESGRIVFTTQRPGDPTPVIAVMDADGSNMRILAPGSAPTWSPDGTTIAFSRYEANRSAGIFVMNGDGSGVRQLTSNPEGVFDEGPTWSPDGRSIVFSRNVLDLSGPDPMPAGNALRDLYAVGVDGTSLTKLVGGPTDDFDPAWSPDGSLIAFVRIADPVAQGRQSTPQIWTVRADGTGATQVTSFDRGAWRPAWAPDGSALAFDDAGSAIYIVGADGGGLRRLDLPSGWGEEAESPFDPVWSPDGTRIAFAAGGEQGHDIFAVDLGGMNLERLTGPSGEDNEPSWVGPPDVATPSVGASPTETATPFVAICFESRSSGDFDGDGEIDTVTLHALVPDAGCGPKAVETDWRFELVVELASSAFSVPFADCQEPFDCELLEGSDFDGDGRSELPIVISPGAAVFEAGFYRVTQTGVRPLELEAPGDPGHLEPGPIRVGGGYDAIQRVGFECRVRDNGSRVVVAWWAERDDAVSPFRVHLTTLELRGDRFVVTTTEDQQDVAELPALHGLCPG